MVQGVEINEDIPQSQILGHHDPGKSISGQDSSLMIKKSRGALNGEMGEESSNIPRTQKLNLRNGSYDGDILPCHARSDRSFAIQQSVKSTLHPCHKLIISLNFSLWVLVETMYQGKSEDPSKANPVAWWSSLAAMVMYFLILLILMQFHSHLTRFLPFLSRVASASGVFLSLSVISLLLPQLPGLILVSTSWALFAVISGWPTLQSAYNCLLTKIRTVTDDVISFAKKWFKGEHTNSPQGITGENTNSQQELPPV